MKKIKAILVLSAILFLCAFVFAACGPKESGYVGMLQFGKGILCGNCVRNLLISVRKEIWTVI